MSNLERRPAEMPAGGLATVSDEPTVRTLAAREVPLGGPRAMIVRRTLPHRELPTVGAWCLADDYGPGAGPMVVPPHPHTGLQTVTWLLSGEVRHQDSVGSDALVHPGALSLMTAGGGIAHAETSTPESPPLRGVQLWVALPDAARGGAPHFEHHPELPVTRAGGVTATVILGRLGDVESPATAFTPIVGAELGVVAPGELPLEPTWEHALLALDDRLLVGGEPVAAGSLVYLGCGRRSMTVGCAGAPSRALLLGGEPFAEELLMWWNFVGRTHDEIVAFREEWQQGLAGEPTRFGRVEPYERAFGDRHGGPLPAPALPGTRLRPRARGGRPSLPRPAGPS